MVALFGLAFALAPLPSLNGSLTGLVPLTRRIILQQARSHPFRRLAATA